MSFAPPFWDEFTTSAPSERATRVSPPGRTRGSQPSPRKTNGRRSMWRGARRPPSTTVGWVESMTMRWAIQAPGSAITAARVASISSRRGARSDQDADAAVAGARLEDQLVEDVERLLELVRLREVVGRDRAQDGLLADVEADHVLDVGVGELVVGHAGPVLVDEPEQPARGRARSAAGRCRSPGGRRWCGGR